VRGIFFEAFDLVGELMSRADWPFDSPILFVVKGSAMRGKGGGLGTELKPFLL